MPSPLRRQSRRNFQIFVRAKTRSTRFRTACGTCLCHIEGAPLPQAGRSPYSASACCAGPAFTLPPNRPKPPTDDGGRNAFALATKSWLWPATGGLSGIVTGLVVTVYSAYIPEKLPTAAPALTSPPSLWALKRARGLQAGAGRQRGFRRALWS